MRYSTIASLLAASASVSASPCKRNIPGGGAKNFIFVIPDGQSAASSTMARTYLSFLDGTRTPEAPGLLDPLPLDSCPVGLVSTYSANNLVTDSAAAGTAFACGVKTSNGALGVNADSVPVGSVMEAAKLAGYLTGLVATSTITHATPAAFFSHVLDRDNFAAIAAQQVGMTHPLNISVDVMLGGGSCYFRPQGQDSCREDDLDVVGYAEEQGYNVIYDRASLPTLEKLPILGLFSNDSDLAYEIDRQQQPEAEREPSLVEMSKVALETLTKASANKEKGYFVMIEASRIDHASHAHDAVAHLHDVLEYQRTIDLVKKWIDEHPDTVMISIADHETGGITLPGGWDPRALEPATHSTEYLTEAFEDYEGDAPEEYLATEILPAYGLTDIPANVTAALAASEDFAQDLADLMNEEIGFEWSTGGHSGVDSVLYAYGSGKVGEAMKVQLAGTWDNTEIPRFIEKVLGVDIDAVTAQYQGLGAEWLGEPRPE